MRSWGSEGSLLATLSLVNKVRNLDASVKLRSVEYFQIYIHQNIIVHQPGQTDKSSSWKTFNKFVSLPLSYLVQWMHHGHVAQQWHSESFSQQVSTQQVNVELMLAEICTSHKNLGHQPVVLRISGEKDWIVFGWSLLQLQDEIQGFG